jgi:BirA family biotin operon repressor/biotin-[acetyl-CoA-carboxylase] ligase
MLARVSLIGGGVGAVREVTDAATVTVMERAPLDAGRLRTALAPRWSRVEVVEETASTNADLLADDRAPDRTVLVAENQIAGRGRFERAWTSPPRAGLTFSVLLRPELATPFWGWLPLLAGVALHEAVDEVTGLTTSLKWPNDLLVADGRKLAGILAQAAGDVVVVGIGLNVDTTAEELPVPTATSLALAGARDLDRTALLVAILTRLDARVAQWTDCHGEAACSTIGRPVRITTQRDGAVVVGTAMDVDDTGRLVVQAEDGVVAISAGDVEHVRPS